MDLIDDAKLSDVELEDEPCRRFGAVLAELDATGPIEAPVEPDSLAEELIVSVADAMIAAYSSGEDWWEPWRIPDRSGASFRTPRASSSPGQDGAWATRPAPRRVATGRDGAGPGGWRQR
jgi:hypothetical protein